MPSKAYPHAQNLPGHAREGLHARFRGVRGLTPRPVLRSPLTLPVVIGEEFTVEEEALWEDYDTVGDGRHSQAAAGKHGQALKTMSPEAMTMTWDPGFLVNPHVTMEHVKRQLEHIHHHRAIFDLLIVNKPHAPFAEFSGFASIRRLAITLKRGEPDTRYLSMDLSAHRRISSRERGHDGSTAANGAHLPTTTTLKDDTTLRSLAEHYYGSGVAWRNIAGANGISKWGSEDPLVDMGRYKVGDRIKIPQAPAIGGTAGIDNNEEAQFFV